MARRPQFQHKTGRPKAVESCRAAIVGRAWPRACRMHRPSAARRPGRRGVAWSRRFGAAGHGDEAAAALLRLPVRGRDDRVPGRRRRRGRPDLAFLQGPAGLFAAAGLRAAGDDARARRRRRAARRIRPRAPALSADPGGAEARHQRLHRRPRTRISTSTAASISAASRAPASLYLQNYGTQPPSAGRLDHHPAGREELPADQRGDVRRARSRKRCSRSRSSAPTRRTRSSSSTSTKSISASAPTASPPPR